MNNMKKILALLMALCVVLSFAACGQTEDTANDTTEAVTTEAQTEASTEAQTEATTESNLIRYTVYIVDEEGNPVPGGMLQFCLETCSPVVIDESGVAIFNGEDVNYDVKFLSLPVGYTYSSEEEVFHFAKGETELTIVLKSEG